MLAHRHAELKDAGYVVFVDSKRRYVDCSPGVSKLLGYSRDELLIKTIDDISYDVSEVPKLFELYRAKGGQQGEFVLQHKNRTPVPIRYKAFVFDDGCNAAIWEPITDWRLPYMTAVLELDGEKQKKHIDQALAAIAQERDSDGLVQKIRDEAVLLLKSMRKKLR